MQTEHNYKPITIGEVKFKQMSETDINQLTQYYNGLTKFIISDEFSKFNHQIRTRLIIEVKLIKQRLKNYID